MLRPQSRPYRPGTNAPCVLASERPSRPATSDYSRNQSWEPKNKKLAKSAKTICRMTCRAVSFRLGCFFAEHGARVGRSSAERPYAEAEGQLAGDESETGSANFFGPIQPWGAAAAPLAARTAWARHRAPPFAITCGPRRAGRALLLAATLVALAWANIDHASYESVWTTRLSVNSAAPVSPSTSASG